jgi:hypothetical protein
MNYRALTAVADVLTAREHFLMLPANPLLMGYLQPVVAVENASCRLRIDDYATLYVPAQRLRVDCSMAHIT